MLSVYSVYKNSNTRAWIPIPVDSMPCRCCSTCGNICVWHFHKSWFAITHLCFGVCSFHIVCLLCILSYWIRFVLHDSLAAPIKDAYHHLQIRRLCSWNKNHVCDSNRTRCVLLGISHSFHWITFSKLSMVLVVCRSARVKVVYVHCTTICTIT